MPPGGHILHSMCQLCQPANAQKTWHELEGSFSPVQGGVTWSVNCFFTAGLSTCQEKQMHS